MPDHLPITRVGGERPRRIRPGGQGFRDPIDRSPPEFARLQQAELSNAEQRQARRRQLLTHIDPDLIFRFRLNQAVQERAFIESLRGAGIEVLAAQPRRDGYFLGFAPDGNIDRLRERLARYGRNEGGAFVRAIDSISEIPVEEKIGPRLAAIQAAPGELVTIDIETLRLPAGKMPAFIAGLSRQMQEFGGRLIDVFEWTSFTIIKIRCPMEHIRILAQASQILYLDLPPPPLSAPRLTVDLQPGQSGMPPSHDAPGILVCDSGVVSAHPLLAACVASEKSYLGDGAGEAADDHGHGTAVAGIAAFGEVAPRIETGEFSHSVWIHSARLLRDDGNGNATWDDDKILEKQMSEAVEWTVANHPTCRVVNVSLGDPQRRMFAGRRQFPLAALLDDLAHRHDIVIVIAAGNYEWELGEAYPQYLFDDLERTKISNPASAALALTVGAYYRHPQRQLTLDGPPATWNYPARYSRAGPGLSGMIKPELIDFGGEGGATIDRDVITLNRDFLSDGRHFRVDFGTSLSAPRIAHLAARLFSKFPTSSANLVKALLLLSGEVPQDRPAPFDTLNPSSTRDATRLHSVYGWGIPNYDRAVASEDQRVVFLAEDEIAIDNIHLYEVRPPTDFWFEQGDRSVDVSLCYDPPISPKHRDYFGSAMEFRLFKNTDAATVLQALANVEEDEDEVDEDDDEAATPVAIRDYVAKLTPGPSLRKRGVHQRGTWSMKRRPPTIDAEKPLVVAVINRKKWQTDPLFRQSYALGIQFEHRAVAGLYTRMRAMNSVQVRARLQI